MDKIVEIERSIIKTYRNKLWAKFIKSIKEYELLKENDKVCVCISGGKDSMLLAKLFQELKKHSDFYFDVVYLVMNPGYNKKNLNIIKDNLKLLNIDACIIETDIFEIANNDEKNPCYLCAKMRRGALYRLAKEQGCNKIALGHHFDDVIETTMMNLLQGGTFQTMLPKLHSLNYSGMELIRPMYQIREKDIINWCKHNELEFTNCACKLTEELVLNETKSKRHETKSKRHETKKLIKELLKYNPNVEKNIFNSISNVNMNKIIGYKKNGEYVSFLNDYDNIKE